jgi:hypothetical protein
LSLWKRNRTKPRRAIRKHHKKAKTQKGNSSGRVSF